MVAPRVSMESPGGWIQLAENAVFQFYCMFHVCQCTVFAIDVDRDNESANIKAGFSCATAFHVDRNRSQHSQHVAVEQFSVGSLNANTLKHGVSPTSRECCGIRNILLSQKLL